MTDLGPRVRRLEDRFEIQDLVARYYNAVDDRDIELVGELFCADGVLIAGSCDVDGVSHRRQFAVFIKLPITGPGDVENLLALSSRTMQELPR